MRPRVQWALFCRGLARDERGLTTLSDLVHGLTARPGSAALWLVASIEGAPEQTVPVTLELRVPGQPPVTLPPQGLTFGADGFVEFRTRLPQLPLSAAGTFSVDLRFGADARPSERVAVKIAPPS
jgi:hypothetical protein